MDDASEDGKRLRFFWDCQSLNCLFVEKGLSTLLLVNCLVGDVLIAISGVQRGSLLCFTAGMSTTSPEL
jgi:hypothetical protein